MSPSGIEPAQCLKQHYIKKKRPYVGTVYGQISANCEILNSHGGDYENSLGCDAAWFGTDLPTIRSNILPLSSE